MDRTPRHSSTEEDPWAGYLEAVLVKSKKTKRPRWRGTASKSEINPMDRQTRNICLNASHCGAQTRSGKSCRCPAIRGRRRCRLHGGLSPGAPPGARNGNFCITGTSSLFSTGPTTRSEGSKPTKCIGIGRIRTCHFPSSMLNNSSTDAADGCIEKPLIARICLHLIAVLPA
jgi:hypothetical protein